MTWDPQQFPAVDMAQLARQMEAEARKAVEASLAAGGNKVTIGRLNTLMV
jgi:hypothetical protein